MPLMNLSDVTTSLQTLLTNNINTVIHPGLSPAATVSTLPPENTPGGPNVLNLYLYHVAEDSNNKFHPQQARGAPIMSSPMSIILYYIVTAHSGAGADFSAVNEQRLLGYALKTFHDYPVIDDGTAFNTSPVFEQAILGRNNRLEIVMRQMTPEESLDYWNSSDAFTAKPSAYYEVRPVILEPEAPTYIPGVVLNLGVFLLGLDTASISNTEGDLPYTLPTELGGGDITLQTSPARVGPVAALGFPTTHNLRLLGTGLSGGEAQRLLISNRHWSVLIPESKRIPVDLVLNAAAGWTWNAVDRGLDITVGDGLQVTRPDSSVDTLALYPGVYMASVEITRRHETPAGARQTQEQSNDALFVVYPRILSVARDPVTGNVTLSIGGSYLLDRGQAALDPVLEPELEILLSVDGIGYARVIAFAGTDNADFTVASHAISYRPLAPANTSGLHTIQLIVDGAESQPVWLEIP